MVEPDGSWLSVSRYGSLNDAEKGTTAVQNLMEPEVRLRANAPRLCRRRSRYTDFAMSEVDAALQSERGDALTWQARAWFSDYTSIFGTASRVMEL